VRRGRKRRVRRFEASHRRFVPRSVSRGVLSRVQGEFKLQCLDVLHRGGRVRSIRIRVHVLGVRDEICVDGNHLSGHHPGQTRTGRDVHLRRAARQTDRCGSFRHVERTQGVSRENRGELRRNSNFNRHRRVLERVLRRVSLRSGVRRVDVLRRRQRMRWRIFSSDVRFKNLLGRR
jgi:hypothetical protein